VERRDLRDGGGEGWSERGRELEGVLYKILLKRLLIKPWRSPIGNSIRQALQLMYSDLLRRGSKRKNENRTASLDWKGGGG
jgi:hypothetical protein